MWAELGNDAGFGLFERHYPVRRTGVPADIANAIAFLCSPDASFITGSCCRLTVDVDPVAREHRDAHEGLHRGEPGSSDAFRSRTVGLETVSGNCYLVAE